MQTDLMIHYYTDNNTECILESNSELVRRIATYNFIPPRIKNGLPSLVFVEAGFELSSDGQIYCRVCKSTYMNNSGGTSKKDILREHLVNSPFCRLAQECWKKISNITESDKQWYEQNVSVVAELTNQKQQKTCKEIDNRCNEIEKTAGSDEFQFDTASKKSTRLKCDSKERLKTFHKWPSTHPIAAKDLADNGFYYGGIEDQTVCAHCGGTLCRWEPNDNVAEEHIKHFPHCSFALRCLETSKLNSKSSKSFFSGIEFDSNKNKPNNFEGCTKLGQVEDFGPRTLGEKPVETKLDAKDLKEEIWKMKERKLCKVCLSKDVDTVFLPCGHLVCCRDCAAKIKHCAICRQLIRGTVLAFIPEDVRDNGKGKPQRDRFENRTESTQKLLKIIG